MSRAEWLRTFVAVYRTGSVTAGARVRGISQPAASQQVAALSKAAGAPLLSRTKDGVAPTRRGQELYSQVAAGLDQLEAVLAELDGGHLSRATLPARIGSSPDLFEGYVLPRIAEVGSSITATFATDADLFGRLGSGEVDLTVTLTPPGRRAAFATHVVGQRRFVLVVSAEAAPAVALHRPRDVADWLGRRPWVSYSHELPVTRRLWLTHFDRAFDADIRLVAPDLRTVATAVAHGVGASLLPDYACHQLLRDGTIVEICDLEGWVTPEPIYCSLRRADAAHAVLGPLVRALERH